MDISAFFEPLDRNEFPYSGETTGQIRLGNIIGIHTDTDGMPDYTTCDIALIGVTDDRRAVGNEGCGLAPDAIRKYLFRLNVGPYPIKMVDLGNIKN